jgi:hypothetical protein
MNFSRLCATLAIVALAFPACSSGMPTVPPSEASSQRMPAFRAHVPAKGDLYVDDKGANVVKIYPPYSDAVKNQITDAPAPVRIAFTQRGVLAVASQKAARRSPTVFLYKAHATTSYAKITLPLAFDSFTTLAFDPKDVLYIANSNTVYAYKLDDLTKPVLTLSDAGTDITNLSFSPDGDLAVSSKGRVKLYKPGSDKPWGHISNVQVTDAIYDTGEYLSVAYFSTSRVGIYPPDSTSPSAEITDGVDRPCTLAVDPKNDLYVASCGGEHHVTVYAESGTNPIRTINRTPFPNRLVVGLNGDLYVSSRVASENAIRVTKRGETEPSLKIAGNDVVDIAISP